MTCANTEQSKHTPWFAKAGAACSIVPIARFVGPNIFALKGGGYGCLFALTGIDEEGLTDLELESRMRSIEGALHGLPLNSCLYQYTRVMSGFDLPRQPRYTNPATEVFASDRLTFLEKTAGFRRIDLHWCLTLEPSKAKAFERKPEEDAIDTSRMLVDLEKTATILQSHLGSTLGLRLLGKAEAFQFFSYLFNLEEWAERDQLRSDTGVDRQIVKSPVAWQLREDLHLLRGVGDDIESCRIKKHRFVKHLGSRLAELHRVQRGVAVVRPLQVIMESFCHTAVLETTDEAHRTHPERDRAVCMIVEEVELQLCPIGYKFDGGPQREEADRALMIAHKIMIYVLGVQQDRFQPEGLDEAIGDCLKDFVAIWKRDVSDAPEGDQVEQSSQPGLN